MKTTIITAALMALVTLSYSQTDKVDKAASKRIASSHIKSCTQVSYNYAFNIQTQTRKPLTKGSNVSSYTYDSRGNIIQEIDYDNYGNIDTKATSKYDSRNNQTEVIVYGSNGVIQSKRVMEYSGDTITHVKYYNPDGTIMKSVYGLMFSGLSSKNTMLKGFLSPHLKQFADTFLVSSGNVFHSLGLYDVKDSSFLGVSDYIYDSKGNLILDYEFDSKQLMSGEIYKYNSLGLRIENDHYNSVDEWTGKRTSKYDDKGNIIETLQIGFNQLPTSITSYKSDSKGNFTEAIYYDSDNVPQQLMKYTYQYFQQ